MGKRKPAPPTQLVIYPSAADFELWPAAARYVGRTLDDFVLLAVRMVCRYLREEYRERLRPDSTLYHVEQETRMQAVLKAAKEARLFLPAEGFHYRWQFIDAGGELDRSIARLEELWAQNAVPFKWVL
jgi:hypothetical protein